MAIKTILLVEDSATDQQFLRELLVPQGYEVISASGGQEGISKAKSLKPDLILMDVVMPGLNGFQATRQLAEDEATRDIPVIICTSKNQETDRIWGLKQGARDFVMKPIDGAELLTKITAQA